MKPSAVVDSKRPSAARLWAAGLLPIVLLAGLVALLAWWNPGDVIRTAPPVERLTFQRVELTEDGIRAVILNDGPDPVKVAQMQVDEAYWRFAIEPASGMLDHLDRATVTIPYPWVKNETHVVRIVTSSGLTFDHEITVAVPTPKPGWRMLAVFTAVGLYVGVIPVALGLLWYPLIGRLGRRGLDFVLALTIGLLLFLLVDAAHDGLQAADAVPGSYQGIALFIFGAFAAYLGIETFGTWLRARRQQARASWVLALLVAIGIGLHNFGEGLAIGAAFALGEAALGALLIIGFTLHNTTEGLAIVAPIAKEHVRVRELVLLGLIGGVPTIFGAWLGGLVYSRVWSVLFLAIGAGAIAQVVIQIVRGVSRDRPVARYLASGPVAAGLLAGFAVMYATGMMVG